MCGLADSVKIDYDNREWSYADSLGKSNKSPHYTMRIQTILVFSVIAN